jgi:hypothetical protein
MLTDFRRAHNIRIAERSLRDLGSEAGAAPPVGATAKQGLRYERRVGKELQSHVASGRFTRLEHNPWFTFTDAYGTANCSPDFVLYGGAAGPTDPAVTIVEVKLTWVEVAIHKLNNLYGPVVSMALGLPALSLIICRNLTPESPPAENALGAALRSPYRLLHWPDIGHILW